MIRIWTLYFIFLWTWIQSDPQEPQILPGCQNYNGLDSCQGTNIWVNETQDLRKWQSPSPQDENWTSSFQHYRDLIGYAHMEYSKDRLSATVLIRAESRLGASLSYSFDGGQTFTSSNTQSFDTRFKSILYVVIVSSDASLALEPIDFVWNAPPLYDASEFKKGQKGAIVDLFGWSWKQVEAECALLSQAGYMGVKINPPNEHLSSYHWLSGTSLNPWYFIYQPVSYKLHARGGTRNELRSMIRTCRSLGVRVYADAVV